MHGPADDAASEEIEYGNQIEPALASEDASRISGPDLIGAPNAKMSEAVRRNWSTVTAVGRSHSIYLERCRANIRSLRMRRAMRLRRPGQPRAQASRGLP